MSLRDHLIEAGARAVAVHLDGDESHWDDYDEALVPVLDAFLDVLTEHADLERASEAWPRLADGLFDFLADIDMPDETLADLDVAIRCGRVFAVLARERVGPILFPTGDMGGEGF